MDIDLCGILVVLVASATIGFGAFWFCFAFVWSLRQPRGERLSYAWRIAWGGISCAGVGVSAFILLNFKPFDSCIFDKFSWVVPLVGIAVGISVVRSRVLWGSPRKIEEE